MLEIKDLIVSYNKQEVLKELSLNIENGTILGLLEKMELEKLLYLRVFIKVQNIKEKLNGTIKK